MAIASLYPTIKPSLLLDFANSKKLDSRVTFTRSTTATYYDGVTTAKAEENLLLRSQDFSATWTLADLTAGSAVTAPDGTATGSSFTASAANGTLTQSVTAIAAQYTFSVYLRRVTGTGDIDITCDSAGTWVTQTITSSWARYTVTQTLTAGTRTPGIRIVTSGDQIEVWGAQLEQRSAATAYTPTTTQPITNYIPVLQTAAAGVPRIDHDPVTGECLGLLIEEQRTNLLTYSEQFDNPAWTPTGVAVTPNVAIAPDGTTTADKLVENAAATNGNIFQTPSLVANTTYTFSVYAQKTEWGWVALEFRGEASDTRIAWFNLNTGAVGTVQAGLTATITPAGNGFYQCAVTGATQATVTSPRTRVYPVNADNTFSTGDGYSGIFIWGAQLEAGAFPTSYIPTTSASVTRTADAASMTGVNFSVWNNAAEGAIYTETIFTSLSSASGVVLNDGTTSNRIRLAPATVSDQATVTTSGTAQAVLDAGTPVAGAVTRLAMAYAVNDFALSLNGGAVATDTSGTVPVVNQFQIGAETTAYGNVRINKIAYYPERLTNAQLQALTA